MYNYLIIGSGLYASVCARELTDLGYKCLVIDKRDHIGGNCYTENKDGINVHKYGPHIFHTSSKRIWDYVNRFTTFNQFKYSPIVNYQDNLYSFPINLFTLYQLYGVKTPEQAIAKLNSEKIEIHNPKNLEDYVISMVGEQIYKTFIYGYTKKQWMTDPKLLPASIIKRIPIRTNFDNNYFDDIYQGIPEDGYTKIFENLLDGIEVRLNTDYFLDRDYLNSLSENIIFTGRIDEYYNYQFGELNYRSLRFETERLEIEDFQGNSVINYTHEDVPFTRISEWKHFENKKAPFTYITKEYPITWTKDETPFYPINNEENQQIYNKYKELSKLENNVKFGGRLAEYKYYDMHQVIGSALSFIKDVKLIK